MRTSRTAVPASDTSALRVWIILWKAAHALEQNALRSVAGLQLGLSDFGVLEVLFHRGPQPVNVLGKKILLASASITAAINRLEAKGLVERKQDQSDKRTRMVQLTPAGRKLIKGALQQHSDDMEEVMAVLRTGERAELVRLLKKVGLWAAARIDTAG